MKVTFLGVGESCDPGRFNTSVLLTLGDGQQALLDCGFSVPHRYFALNDHPESLAVVWSLAALAGEKEGLTIFFPEPDETVGL